MLSAEVLPKIRETPKNRVNLSVKKVTMSTLLLVVTWDDFSPVGKISFKSCYNYDEEFLILEMVLQIPAMLGNNSFHSFFSWKYSANLYSVQKWTLGLSVSLISSSLRQSFLSYSTNIFSASLLGGPVYNPNVRTSTESLSKKQVLKDSLRKGKHPVPASKKK